MPKIQIINGVNLNLLGKREPTVYGDVSFEDFFEQLQTRFKGRAELGYYQSNMEGELVERLHSLAYPELIADGVLLNAGAYTHTSIALRDAIAAIPVPVLEVHISNIHARETFRHHSYLSAVCCGQIVGLGLQGYVLGVEYFLSKM